MWMMAMAVSTAQAGGTDAVSVLLGASTAFDQDPASVRLSIRGELGLDEGDVLGVGFVLPVTIATTGEDGFGVSSRQTLVELPLTLRGNLFPRSPIRGYGDLGLGAAIGTRPLSEWLIEGGDSTVVFMSRAALGVEIGDPDGLALVLEPVSTSTYFGGRKVVANYGWAVGVDIVL